MILTKSFQIGAVALAVVVASTRVASAQNLSVTIPAKYTDACDLDRSDLTVRVVAHNEEIYPGQVARTSRGWLVYDKYGGRFWSWTPTFGESEAGEGTVLAPWSTRTRWAWGGWTPPMWWW